MIAVCPGQGCPGLGRWRNATVLGRLCTIWSLDAAISRAPLLEQNTPYCGCRWSIPQLEENKKKLSYSLPFFVFFLLLFLSYFENFTIDVGVGQAKGLFIYGPAGPALAKTKYRAARSPATAVATRSVLPCGRSLISRNKVARRISASNIRQTTP